MDRLRYIAAGGIFIFLTALKLLVPGAAQQLRSSVEAYICPDFDYTAAFAYADELCSRIFSFDSSDAPTQADTGPTTSTHLSSRDAAQLRRVLIPELSTAAESPHLPSLIPDESYFDEALSAQEPQPSDPAACDKPDSAQESVSDTAQDAEPEASPAPSPEPETPDCVQTFLDSQSEFSDLAVPAGVTYSFIALPFDCGAPVSGLRSDGFGYRMHPILGEVRFHYGTDFAANSGDAVCAFAGGTVTFAGESDSYGKYIIIAHPDGWQTLYAHCSVLYVSSGDSVERGQLIALVGSTGLATGPHLHLELTHDGTYLNPEYYVNCA
jgi:murein DD-endopeptidase MepM/ murein hydrolase activator NlpD